MSINKKAKKMLVISSTFFFQGMFFIHLDQRYDKPAAHPQDPQEHQ